jgi:subtilisin family serine protease
MKAVAPLAVCAWAWAGTAAGAQRGIAPAGRAQIRALEQEKRARTPAQRKIESRLLFAVYKQRTDPRLAQVPRLRTLAPETDGRMLVDIDLETGGLKRVMRRLRAIGAEIVSHSTRARTIRARVALTAIEALAGSRDVRRIGVAQRPLVHKLDTSEGDVAHRAAEARGFFGVDGAGQKVCVLSDGVDSLAAVQASGDLPAVDVLPGQAGSGDEGTAMLEIVHDLAPGATLGFATAVTSAAQFAQNILDLRAAGCDVLVDDVLYLEESPFQDSLIAAAVDSVTASGALCFSSAGNEGNLSDLTAGTWEGDFRGNGAIPGITGTAHDFGDGGQSILLFAESVINTLHWTDPFGASGNDYDLYIMDFGLTTVFDSSTNVQDGNDDPFEITSTGALPLEQLVVVKQGGAAERMINLFAPRGLLDFTLSTNGATRGHAAAADAFSVAAVDAASAGGAGGEFVGIEPVESFSSDGPRRIFFDDSGALLPGAPPGDFSASGGVVRQKPDLAAADGVSTATPGFSPFFGTSAAAPHAAAVAALVRQAFPAFTPAEIRAALLGSALDIEAPGTDRDSGAGIVMAYETLADNGAPAAASLAIAGVEATPEASDGDAFLEPGEAFSLAVSLRNQGGAGATALSATLTTSTPGVTITRAASSYPDLAPSASAANDAPFAFSLESSLECGSALRFHLTVAFSGGVSSPAALDFDVDSGQPGSALSFSHAGAVVPIPDALGPEIPGPPAVVLLTASGVGRVHDVDFRIDGSLCTTSAGAPTVGIDHSFVEDLHVELESPQGTTTTLISRTGEDGNNFCQTLLDDDSPGPSIQGLPSSSAPFTGSFLPATPLAGLRGEQGDGTWTLRLFDYFEGDAGNLRAVSLRVTPLVCDAQRAHRDPVLEPPIPLYRGDRAPIRRRQHRRNVPAQGH